MAIAKYAAKSNAITKNPITFEMINEKLKDIKAGKKIKMWIPRKKAEYDKSPYRIVKGKVKRVHRDMILVQVQKRGQPCYNECFLKKDLYGWHYQVS